MKIEVNIDEDFIASQGGRSCSFSESIRIFTEQAKELRESLKIIAPTHYLDSKLMGYEFAKICGMKVPKVLQAGVPLEKTKFASGTVVKPFAENASKGVFIAYSSNNIVYLNKGEKHASEAYAKRYARRLLTGNIVRQDRWMVEELLIEKQAIARDVKIYCFYGEVGLILETERQTGIRRCWFDSDLNYVETGKYRSNLFKGSREGLPDLVKKAEAISKEIPSAFVRIDFLICNGETYVGEFTPMPAGYSEFNRTWDILLGEMYLRASTRLSCDAGRGKVFDKFNMLPKSMSGILEKINK